MPSGLIFKGQLPGRLESNHHEASAVTCLRHVLEVDLPWMALLSDRLLNALRSMFEVNITNARMQTSKLDLSPLWEGDVCDP